MWYSYVLYRIRAVYRNFTKGGRIWGMDKRGGARRAEAQWYHVRCYTVGGGKNDPRGVNAPPPPPPPHPPLNTALRMFRYTWQLCIRSGHLLTNYMTLLTETPTLSLASHTLCEKISEWSAYNVSFHSPPISRREIWKHTSCSLSCL